MTKWQTKKLSEVCIIRPPKNEAKEKLNANDYISFLPMRDLGIAEKRTLSIQERKLKDVYGGYTYFSNNDVLLAKITPCFENGKLGIAHNLKNGIGFGSSEYIVFRAKKLIIPEYLFYFLSNPNFRNLGKKRMSGAVGHKRVSKEFISNFQISFPVLSEQKRIVKIIDKSFVKIEKAKKNLEKNLQNSKDLFEAYLQNTFLKDGDDWEMKRLNEIAVVEKKKNNRNDLPYIGMEDIESNSGSFLGNTSVKNVKSSTFYFSKNHILYGRLRPYLNKILIPSFEGHCSTEIFPIKNLENINKKFLFYWLFRQSTVDRINKTCTGARMPRANMKEVFDFIISFPKSIEKQKQIVKKLDLLSSQTQALEKIYTQKLANLEELKKSILQKAFAGEL